MRLTELFHDLGVTAVVDATTGAGPSLAEGDGITVVEHLHDLGGRPHGDDVGVVVGCAVGRLDDALDALDAVAGLGDEAAAVGIVVVRGPAADLDPDGVARLVATRGRVLRRAVALSYATAATALVLSSATDDPEDGSVLSLYRLVAADLRGRAVAAWRDGDESLRAEVDRRGGRIEVLRREVDDLRARLTGVERRTGRELEARDRTIDDLRRRIDQLRSSTSYRLGHALVLLVREPRRLALVPGQVLRLVRRRFGR